MIFHRIRWFALDCMVCAMIRMFGIYDTFDAFSDRAPWMKTETE